MPALEHDVDALAERTGFSGVVHVESGSGVELSKAYGLADRGHGIPNTTETQFGLASGTKGLTALTVVSLIDDGLLDLSTTARSALGRDLPLIADDVTVEHLLAHRSGIGDYYDEDTGGDITDYILPIPVHRLETTAGYLPALEGYPTAFPAGERFTYCNGGFVVLALIAERAAGRPFHDLVRERVCGPAGMERHGVPALPTNFPGGRRSGISRTTACGRTCSTCPSAEAATAGSTRRRPTSARSGARSSPGRSSRPRGWRR